MSATAASADSNHATLREFCDAQGWKPSYGHQLKREGRLVLHTDGKTVLVAESIARIAATRDPSKQGVAERHAAGRAARATAADADAAKAPDLPSPQANTEEDVGKTYHASKAVKEKYLALAARRDYEESIKLLTCTHDAYFHIENAMTICRATLERLPSSLSPQMAALNDEKEINKVLTNHIEHILSIMSNELKKLGE